MKFLVRKLGFFLLIFLPVLGWSQFQFDFNDSIPVVKLGNTLENPWAGGLNYPQFTDLDYDFDGDLDLLVFDRSNDQIRVFRNDLIAGVRSYHFDPYAENKFPSDVRYRAFCYDYDLDGKKDLFTYGIGGIKAYRNVGNGAIGLQWALAKNLIYSNYNGTFMGLYVSSADVPALVDVDGDNDMDILTFSISGDHVEYHKNVSQELYGHADSLVFVLKNKCWGGFREDVTSNAITLFDNSSVCTGSNVPNPEFPTHPSPEEKAHSGSTILAFDIDNSGVLDAVIGDVSNSNLTLLINGGALPNANSQMMSANASFPSNSIAANLQIFPAAYYLDVDFDGKKDIVVSPNARGTSENESSAWKYKNQGTVANPVFIHQTNAFLQEEMIEHGIGSVPVFADVTNDGLPDLFVSNYFAYKPTLQKETRIAYYKNTGTLNAPVFTFIDDDFLNLSQQNLGFRMIPTFGDLTGDGKPELLIGLENGSILYFQNTTMGSSPTFSASQSNYAGIQIGQYAAPQLFDLNKDSLLDLVVGEKTGKLLYFQNAGTSSIPVFTQVSALLGGIDIETATPDGFPQPHFFTHLDTTYLMVGGYDGKIRFYDSIDVNLLGNYHLRSFPFLGVQVGAFSAVYVADIDNDSQLDLYVGQDLGGVFRLEHKTGANLGMLENQSVTSELFPNPLFDGILTVRSTQNIGWVTIYDVYGKLKKEIQSDTMLLDIDLSDLEKGVYFLRTSNGKSLHRFVKL